jgi:D-alanyl-D-alanine carboxypeptidase
VFEMITANNCLQKYGAPELEKNMVLWDVPAELEIGAIPKRLYCNKDMVKPLERAFRNIISRGLVTQLKTWDGCFNIRSKRGANSASLHSWGIAIDINAAWNQFGKPPTMSSELVKCFTDSGFDWGGCWNKPDGMHFQLSVI